MYNNAWFVLAFDENSQEIRYFKLNRIERFEVLTEKFRVLLSYKESDYLDEYGMKQFGEWFAIKLQLSGSSAMLAKERIYGKDQKIECPDEKTTILSCKMQNKNEIVKFVLGLGNQCTVLEPQWLKDEVVAASLDIIGKYKV